MNISFIYPPGRLFMRGEDRCQSNIEESAATAIRACNDLGYAAAVARKKGYRVFLRDYMTERLSFGHVIMDLKQEKIDILCVSCTNATIYEDIDFINNIKRGYKELIIILKSAIFYDPAKEMLSILDLENVDYLIGGEIEFVIGDLLDAIEKKTKLLDVDGILFKDNAKQWVKTRFHCWNDNLDSLPFPARDLMKNELYIRPDTGEMMATIQVSKGCPSKCIYCLTPIISGRCIRKRSPQNVYEEIVECVKKYRIYNFFFKADTFTMDSKWVGDLCDLIIQSRYKGKISFTANSRVRPLAKETLVKMKEAGCFMVAFGFETESERTMARIMKGASIEENRKAVKFAREAGIPVYGFFMIGFPWEGKRDIEMTKRHIMELKPDFIEVSIALPFYGTVLYDIAKENGLVEKNVLGTDYFHAGITGAFQLSIEDLEKIRRNILFTYYFRFTYLFSKVKDISKNPKAAKYYVVYGCRLIRNLLFRRRDGKDRKC